MRLASRLLLVVLLVSATETWAEPLGLWWTEDDLSQIEIYRCDTSICAKIVMVAEPLDDQGRPRIDRENPDPTLRDRSIVGIEILKIPAEQDKNGVWRNGRIYDPQSGKTYKCMLWEEAGQLKLKGYIGIPLLGRKTTWRPADAPAKPGADPSTQP